MRVSTAILISRGAFGAVVADTLRSAGWTTCAPTDAIARDAALVVVDPEALGKDVQAVLKSPSRVRPDLPTIIVGGNSVGAAVDALRAGAADFVPRDLAPDDYHSALSRVHRRHSLDAWRSRRTSAAPAESLWGESAAIEQLKGQIDRASSSEASVVVVGECGTGKELVARLLHGNGRRARGPFVVVACASVHPLLAESELFGHVKGAFSGAGTAHRGLLAAANGGTLFLDDVGSIPLGLQAKLLRSFQERAVRPVGSNQEIRTDFRLVVSSTIELDELVQSERMRADLYYRLAVLELRLPPLRDRGYDVLVLAERFLTVAAERMGKRVTGFTPGAEEILLLHSWPGNVRELQNAIDYSVAVARYSQIGEDDLPRTVRPRRMSPNWAMDGSDWEAVEARHIEAVLRAVGGNRSRAAEQLGIDRKTLQRKLERFAIDVPSRSGTRRRVTPEEAAELDQVSPKRFNLR
jgi:DNA-binding NtrC family response regulator